MHCIIQHQYLRELDVTTHQKVLQYLDYKNIMIDSSNLQNYIQWRCSSQKKQISDAIIKTVKASGLKECYIRPLAYYGYGTMGLTPTQNKVDVSIACWAWKMGESKAGKFSGAKMQSIKLDKK